MMLYSWQTVTLNGEDKVIKLNDDVLDGIRYAIYTDSKEYNNDDNNLLNMQWDDYSVKICNVYYHFDITTLVISLVFSITLIMAFEFLKVNTLSVFFAFAGISTLLPVRCRIHTR